MAHCWFCNNSEVWLASGRPLARLQNRLTPFVCQACAEKASQGNINIASCTFCGRVNQSGLNSPKANLCQACADLCLSIVSN